MVNEQKENLIYILSSFFFKGTSNVTHFILSILHSDWSHLTNLVLNILAAN